MEKTENIYIHKLLVGKTEEREDLDNLRVERKHYKGRYGIFFHVSTAASGAGPHDRGFNQHSDTPH